MNDFKTKLLHFMSGRYGTDQLNQFLFGFSLVCLIISLFGFSIFSKIALALIIIYAYRMLSKNYNQRYQENQIYLKNSEKIRWRYNELKKNFAYKKTHKIFKCSKCGKKLSVPRGKGKIEISCPCGNKFQKKS